MPVNVIVELTPFEIVVMTALPCASLRNCCKVAKSLIPVARRSTTSSPSPEICDNVVVLAGEGVDKGVPARASGQNIVAILAAEDIVAVAARQRVIEVAAEEPVVAGRSGLVDGARGLAIDHVGGALRIRAARRTNDDVAVSVAVDVAGAGDRRPEMGGSNRTVERWLRPSIRKPSAALR